MAERSKARPKAASPGAREAAFQMASTPNTASDSRTIKIVLNGDPYLIDGDARVSALIERLKMRPTRIAVEINREVIPKAKYAETLIKPGDEVEVINFVGGG